MSVLSMRNMKIIQARMAGMGRERHARGAQIQDWQQQFRAHFASSLHRYEGQL